MARDTRAEAERMARIGEKGRFTSGRCASGIGSRSWALGRKRPDKEEAVTGAGEQE